MSSAAPEGSHRGTGHHHSGRRLRQFLRPDGRRVHIASTPEEAIRMRQHLESGDEPFDLYIHGSPEHLEALREVHGHHERRHNELRQRHGDVYEDFEKVRLELDALSQELRLITQHGVALDANFSKYGYSAHLRTRGDQSHSSTASTLSDGTSEQHDWKAEKSNGYTIRFYKRPVVRQYFHKGLLWRAPESEEVASYELFVDLLYVGIIAVNGDTAANHATGGSFLRFCITFILSWKIWTDFTLVISWFESDDIFQRICVLFVLACLFGYTTNVVESDHSTYKQMIAFFLTARLFGALNYVWMTVVIPMIRPVMIGHAILVVVASALWIASIHVHEPSRQALIWLAIAFDLWGVVILIFLVRGSRYISKRFGARMQELFEFYPAVNIEHKTERTNAFVTLVFGYSVVALLYQNRAEMGVNAFYGKAILGLMQAFSFNWIYFEVDGINLYKHAIRRKIWSSMVWGNIHLPFIMSYVLGAAALSRLVIAHDCANADLKTLSHDYLARSYAEIHSGLRWFYCAGLGIALACMGIISMCHTHKDIAQARLKKWHRLTVRFIISIILICLPKADRLNSLQLISVVTGLIVLTLIVELYGLTKVGEAFFGSHRQKKCTYWADCPLKKKDLEEAVKTGEVVNIEAMAEKDAEDGHKGHYEMS